jgi:hypothetical protein
MVHVHIDPGAKRETSDRLSLGPRDDLGHLKVLPVGILSVKESGSDPRLDGDCGTSNPVSTVLPLGPHSSHHY